MIQTSILDQIILFFNIFMKQTNKYIILGITIGIILLFILANKFKNKKITKVICFIIYVSIFGYLIYMYQGEILNLLDYLMDNLVRLLLFPNLAIYILVLVIVNIFIIKSTFSNKDSNFQKNINIIYFGLFNILFYLIVNNIITNQINVYEQLDIYTNKELLNLIVLNMKIFVIWLFTILIIKFINHISSKVEIRKHANNYLNLEQVDDNYGLSEVKKVSKKKIKPYNIYNDYIDVMPIKKAKKQMFIEKQEVQEIKPIPDYPEFNKDLINNNFENIDNDSSVSEEKVFLKPLSILDNNPLEITTYEENKEDYNLNNKIPTLDELLPFKDNNKHKYQLSLDDTSIERDIPDINLENYDSIFKENKEISPEFDHNMHQVFSNNNLESILLEIEKLKYNKDDKNKIEDIYYQIKLRKNDLSLNDYNYLINRLLEIKK